MSNEDIQPVLRKISDRLGAIEATLKSFGDHEKRLRAVEIKLYTIWVGMILAGGVAGYWLEKIL